MLNKAIVVATHPDDETLGCGATLLKHKQAGDKIYWIIATSPKQDYGHSQDVITKEAEQIKAAAKMYNFDGLYKLDLPPAGLDQVPLDRIIGRIAAIFEEIEPGIIYLPFLNDVHSDHRIIFNSCNSCIKSFRYPFIKRALMMEVVSETEFAPSLKGFSFLPNYFVDVSDYLEKKIEIMKIFNNELGEQPFPRSIENIKALAISRGSQINCRYAESFMLLKQIWK